MNRGRCESFILRIAQNRSGSQLTWKVYDAIEIAPKASVMCMMEITMGDRRSVRRLSVH